MSTPEEPPQLTRRQLRELRNTAATPIITDAENAPPSEGAAQPDEDAHVAAPTDETPVDETPVAEAPPAPLPRAAEPITLPDAPVEPDAEASAPSSRGEERSLTRREIRQRERLRTASVPVITAEVLAATRIEQEPDDSVEPDDATHAGAEAGSPTAEEDVIEAEVITDSVDTAAADVPDQADPETSPQPEQIVVSAPDPEPATPSAGAREESAGLADEQAAESAEPPERHEGDAPQDDDERRVVAPALGADLLQGQPSHVEVPASFDQLLTRGSATGALSMPNALILSQTPEGGSLTSPVAATGEILITGTFALPDHYGATGTVPGRADGKEVDAVLVDGELPAASSPTPIAASAAISTIKSADEIIKPPAPERGSRLMFVLAITAGVLAVALAGVLILAITTGIF
jgi:hypothetical protein